MLLDLLLVVEILVAAALTAVILLQRSEGGALGMGGGPSGFMTARGAGDLLTRTTSILAAVFFILAIAMTIISGRAHSGGSVVDRPKVQSLSPDALNRAMHQLATPPAQQPGAPAGAAPATAPATGAAPIGLPAVGPAAAPTVTAPTPQVHTLPAARPSAPPTATVDNGVRGRSSHVLGLQAAPQSAPTVAPRASTPAPAASTPAPSTPAPAASAPAPSTPAPTAPSSTSNTQ